MDSVHIRGCEFEILSLLIDYPDFFKQTILKENYFKNNAYGKLFKILKEEYDSKKVLLLDSLTLNAEFDIDLYVSFMSANVYHSSKDTKFIECEKIIIDNYKERVIDEVLRKYSQGDITYHKMFGLLEKVNNITYQEISYITLKDMENEMFSEQKRINFRFEKISADLNLIQNDLLIIAGTTGSGKTAFALNLLEDLSNKYPCIYFNLEMSKSVLYKRLVSLQTKIPISELNDYKNLDDRKKQFVNMSMQNYDKRKIALVNNSQTITSIKKFISNYKTDKHFIVFIDHIGLINSKAGTLYERATEIAKELRRISLDYNCTIIALCQLSRKACDDEEPKLSHLRDSGEIEQSARKVLLLNPINKGYERRQAIDIIIAKNDNGVVGAKGFIFDKYCQCFYENKEDKK